MDDKFEIVWQALVENGSCQKSREAVKRFWDTLLPAQQKIAADNIPHKVRTGKYVQFNPIRAIQENIRTYQMPEPTNYNGRTLKAGVQYVIAKYKGSYGTYTLAEAKKFGMEIKSIISR